MNEPPEDFVAERLDQADARLWLESIGNPNDFRLKFIAMEKRIAELEGKLARAKEALENADKSMGGLARISFRKHIAAAWKELSEHHE